MWGRRQPRLDLQAGGGVRSTDRHTEESEHLGRQAEFGGDLERAIADRAHIGRAKLQGLYRHRGVLRGERGVDGAQQETLKVIQRAGRVPALGLSDGAQLVLVDQPDQEKGRIADEIAPIAPRPAGSRRRSPAERPAGSDAPSGDRAADPGCRSTPAAGPGRGRRSAPRGGWRRGRFRSRRGVSCGLSKSYFHNRLRRE